MDIRPRSSPVWKFEVFAARSRCWWPGRVAVVYLMSASRHSVRMRSCLKVLFELA